MLGSPRFEFERDARAADRDIPAHAVMGDRANIGATFADQGEQLLQLAGLVVQIDLQPRQTAGLGETVADDAIEQVAVDVAAADDYRDAAAAQLGLDFERA